MAGPRQPTNLVVLNGRKHFTRAELEARRSSEVAAPSDLVAPPDYLSEAQRQRFVDLACELLRVEIMGNLDCDALARYIQVEEKYLRYDALVSRLLDDAGEPQLLAAALEKLEGLRDRAFKQCRSAAGDLGLTISSRCRLVVPRAPEPARQNKFDRFGADTG